jgi:hypothetical protein
MPDTLCWSTTIRCHNDCRLSVISGERPLSADLVDLVDCRRRSSVIPSFRGLIPGARFDDGQAIGAGSAFP